MNTPDASDEPAVRAVLAAHRALDAAGQNDLIWGHVGVRDPQGRGVWSKASGRGMNEVRQQDVLLVSFDGEVILGEGDRHLEVFIHTELLRARPDVTATVHSHALEAAVFASLDEPLRPITHAATPFLDPQPEGPADVRRFNRTGDLVRNADLGRELAAALGSGNGALIPGHGMVTLGADVATAVLHAVLLQNACRAHLMAAAAGGPRRWSSDAEVSAKRDGLWPATALNRAYEHLVRAGSPHGSADDPWEGEQR